MNPFAVLAGGYAHFRPAVHPVVIRRVLARLAGRRFRSALDIGCGSGLSTRPLLDAAARVIGIEPAVDMLAWAPGVAPGACFAAASADSLPFQSATFDLITAAGSLNYVDIERFFPEAARVLSPGGVLVAYDFSPGRSFPDSPALGTWFDEFIARYPWPPAEARELNPSLLAAAARGFRLQFAEDFEIPLDISPGFYLEYMMTETNVAYGRRRGVPEDQIRRWCEQTLQPVFQGHTRSVVFRGYSAVLSLV